MELKKRCKMSYKQRDRNKNCMIFGLPQRYEQELDATVGKLFEAISDKPIVEIGLR